MRGYDMSVSNKFDSDNFKNFIDLLYAVVIGQSFVFLVDEKYYANWFSLNGREIMAVISNASIESTRIFGIGTLLVLYLLIISSWINYHTSVVKHSNGLKQFAVDIFLLFAYYVAFSNANNFITIIFMMTLIFTLYFVWDFIIFMSKRMKSVTDDLNSVKRLLYSDSIITAVLVTIAIISKYYHNVYFEWGALLVVFVCIFEYTWMSVRSPAFVQIPIIGRLFHGRKTK
jgi:hypothetical protein